MSPAPGRRSFLATLGSLTGLAALELARPATAIASTRGASMPAAPWDLTWLDDIKGKHRQVFDIGNLDNPLGVVTNYLDAVAEVFGLSYPDVNTVVGIGGSGFPINAGDALWVKYEIGRRWEVKDPATSMWSKRNIFLDATLMRGRMVGVKPLMARGTIFWQCNNALNFIVGQFAADTKQPVDQVRAEVIAGLNPGVRLVPAHTLLIGLAQEHGCTYESL